MDSRSDLMVGRETSQLYRRDEATRNQVRWEAPLRYTRMMTEDTAKRVEASRQHFNATFFRGCCHSHTQHSDGLGTVAETAESVKAAGLDFQFVTDHWGVTQAPECAEHGLWVGQEPGTKFHHLGILGLDHAYEVSMDLVKDFAEVRRRGGTPFIPHPTGWWPKTVYSKEQTDALLELPTPFLMEIVNGANNIVTAVDYTDDSARALWDELLMTGRKVHAMGNTDAHSPHAIGMVWNGVFAERCGQATILSAMSAGRLFVSDAPLLDLSIGKVGMGGTLEERDPAARITIKVVDSRGLLRVRLIADGEVCKSWHLDDDVVFAEEVALAASYRRYVRVECTSSDGRRGFTNPVYLA